MENEFTKIVTLEDVRDKGFEYHHKATTKECEALAKRLNLEDMKSFEVEGDLSYRKSDRVYKVSGTLAAEITQICSVTLEPFTHMLQQDFEEKLILEKDFDKESYKDLESWEVPEIINADEIDYGEVITQVLSLSIDPYPRKPGAEVDAKYRKPEGQADAESGRNPFSVLEKLKKKSNDG